MRKITQLSVNAFNEFREFKQGNTQVRVTNLGKSIGLYLHNNLIAVKGLDGSIAITNAGWESNTTKERLNGIDGVSIRQVKGVWYLNGQEWNGEWIRIK